MRFKICVFSFAVLCDAIEWIENENKAFTGTISSFSTLDKAKEICLEMPECGGVTKNSLTDYELRKVSELKDITGSYKPGTTWAKSLISGFEIARFFSSKNALKSP